MISGIRIFVLALLLPVAAHADAVALQTVKADLAAVRTGRSHFIEDKYVAALTAPLQSEGTLSYTAPDHIEKRTTGPEPMNLIVIGDQLTIERDGSIHTLDLSDHADIQLFVESIRATLSGNWATLQQYYTVDFSGTVDKWQLFLQPTDTGIQQMVTSITINGSDDRLTRIETQQTNGDHSDMTITPIAP